MNKNIDHIDEAFHITHAQERPQFLIVCEHASNHIPAQFQNLGLSEAAAASHIAWDPGALGVAHALVQLLSGVLIEGTVSRLVYDCNRPPEAASAIPEKSEVYQISGNANLSTAEWDRRVQDVYIPFSTALTDLIKRHHATLDLMVTIHSFTPVYNGVERAVQIGVLHGQDDQFAKRMMQHQPQSDIYDIRLNEPYAASDGVAHTLDAQGARHGLANVMIEIRNDLIQTQSQQDEMASYLANWIQKTLESGAQEGPTQ